MVMMGGIIDPTGSSGGGGGGGGSCIGIGFVHTITNNRIGWLDNRDYWIQQYMIFILP